MILSDLLARCYERLNYQSSPASSVTTRLTNLLNEAQRRVLRTPGLTRLRPTTTGLTFASVAAQSIYGLPQAISRVLSITDRTTMRQIVPLTLPDLRASDPGLAASGTPYGYVPLGTKPVMLPPVATGLWIVSSSASDTVPTVQINGIRSGGLVTLDVVTTLTGTSRAAVGGAGAFTDYVDVTSISLSAVCVGLVSVYDAASSGNLLAQIPIGSLSPEYTAIQLYPTPTAAITYYVDGALKMPQMDDAQDVPVIPEDFHELLVYGALVLEYEHQDDPRITLAQMAYKEGLSALKFHVSQMGDAPVFGGASAPRASRLGSWTPAD